MRINLSSARPALLLGVWTAVVAAVPLAARDLAPDSGASGAAPPACRRAAVEVERVAYVMGTILRAHTEGVARECALEAMEAAFREVERLEAVLSSWRADSEIGRLNAAPAGVPVRVSKELIDLLVEAGEWVRETGGAFDPAVGGLMDAWELRGAGRIASDRDLAAARAVSGWRHVRLDGDRATRLVAGVRLDTGGFGKGAALRAAAEVLRSRGIGEAVLDFGGQLMILGEVDSIAVAHPAVRSAAAAWLRVEDASIATTSASERFVETAEGPLGHVVDPRSGRPVTAWGSVTVVMADPLAADALSTALFVLGPHGALEWAAGREDVGVLVLRTDESGRVVPAWNAAMARHLLARPDTLPGSRTSPHSSERS